MNETVLIAYDNTDVVDLLMRRCRACGLNVDSANNALAALNKAADKMPDLVILDAGMPYKDGQTLCEMMANHEGLRTIPVVVITDNANEEAVRQQSPTLPRRSSRREN